MTAQWGFSNQSKAKLATCHPDLQRLFNRVIEIADCTILCGHRSKDEQTVAYATGHSKLQWPDSKHNATPSLAVDVMPYPINWDDRDRLMSFSEIVKSVAKDLGIEIVWGGDWLSIQDLDHWQLGAP